jgi:hypothetical protein
MLGYRSIVA